MTKNIAAHVASVLSGAGAALALIHPGFTIPPFVQGLVTSLCVLVAAGIQVVHLAGKQSIEANIAMAAHAASVVAAATPAAPAAPTTPTA